MNLIALGDRVFVIPDPTPEQTTDGLLHLVSDRARSLFSGTVVAVGEGPETLHRTIAAYQKKLDAAFDVYIHDDVLVDGVRAVAAHLKQQTRAMLDAFEPEHLVLPGDRILFSPEAGEEVKTESGVFLVMRETDILAIIEPASEEMDPA